MKTIKMVSMRYALAPALLALCAGSSQAAAQLAPARTMTQTQADVDGVQLTPNPEPR